MKQCPLCQSEVSDSTLSCDHCGYDFDTAEITDRLKARAWVRSALDMPGKINREKRVHQIQIQKHGPKSKTPGSANAPGWSMRDTAGLLGVVPATISLHFKQKGTPEAGNEKGFKSEDNLQDFIFNNWEETSLASEWDRVSEGLHKKGKVDTGEVGEMDFLAKHKTKPRWLVIELKVKRSSDNAVGQVLRYMGWVKRKRATDDELVEGLIIAGTPDLSTCYALLCTENIDYQLYKLVDGKLQLTQCDIDNYFIQQALRAVANMTPEEREEVRRNL